MTEPAGEPTEATRQNTLSWQARQDIIDYLRNRPEPIVANTKTEAAAIVASATGVEITGKQLWYLIEQLPKLKLENKFVIGALTEPQEIMRRDINSLSDELTGVFARLTDGASKLERVVLRVTEIERREQAIIQAQDEIVATLHKIIARIEGLERMAGVRAKGPADTLKPLAEVFTPTTGGTVNPLPGAVQGRSERELSGLSQEELHGPLPVQGRSEPWPERTTQVEAE